MNTPRPKNPPPPAGISVRDVYYVLFRHKVMIIVLTAIGVAAALGVLKFWPFPYNSEAKVLIHFIADATAPAAVDGKANPTGQVTTPDERGANVLNTQLEFLTSGDLALEVATNLGPDKILGKSNSSVTMAAASIRANLLPDVPKNSDIITLTYSATDPQIVQLTLAKLLDAYQQKFTAVYRTPSFTDEDMIEQTGRARENLSVASQALDAEKVRLGITDLPEAMKDMSANLSRTELAVFETRTELAEAEATIKDLQERLSIAVTNTSLTNQVTNLVAIPPPPAAPSADVVAKYQNLNSILSNLRIREQSLLSQFTTNTKVVQSAMQQTKQAEDNVAKFEAENPSITAVKTNLATPTSPALAAAVAKEDPYTMLYDEQRKRDALVAKYKELTNQLATVRTNVVNLDSAESRIKTMESEYEVADSKYKLFLMASAQSHMNDNLASKVSGISVIEEPTAPSRDAKTVLKVVASTGAFFLVLAFGLPFFIEMILDQSLKNPTDVQARVNAHFFLTIPKTNGKVAALKRSQSVPLLANGSDAPGSANGEKVDLPPSNGKLATWDKRHALQPFFEALRDRLMTFFEMNNLTHKPKLVAVTSCGCGAGVTTTAVGLASSLSETGDGNVLLVNMNVENGEAHHFYKGKMDCAIEDALQPAKRDNAQVHDNLYVALEGGSSEDSLPRMMPKRFSRLLPLMKDSNFDYIIFDMPPVSEISITPRLSRFMDLVLLVIESEKTSREAASRVASRLAESNTRVGLVLNKNHSYVPKMLDDTI